MDYSSRTTNQDAFLPSFIWIVSNNGEPLQQLIEVDGAGEVERGRQVGKQYILNSQEYVLLNSINWNQSTGKCNQFTRQEQTKVELHTTFNQEKSGYYRKLHGTGMKTCQRDEYWCGVEQRRQVKEGTVQGWEEGTDVVVKNRTWDKI